MWSCGTWHQPHQCICPSWGGSGSLSAEWEGYLQPISWWEQLGGTHNFFLPTGALCVKPSLASPSLKRMQWLRSVGVYFLCLASPGSFSFTWWKTSFGVDRWIFQPPLVMIDTNTSPAGSQHMCGYLYKCSFKWHWQPGWSSIQLISTLDSDSMGGLNMLSSRISQYEKSQHTKYESRVWKCTFSYSVILGVSQPATSLGTSEKQNKPPKLEMVICSELGDKQICLISWKWVYLSCDKDFQKWFWF